MAETRQLAARYLRLHRQLAGLFDVTQDPMARMATTAALLHNKLGHAFWTGFYLVRKDALVVGPYQGPLACQVLEGKKGVCWTAVLGRKTVIVPDVRNFPEHHACDKRARSEIAVPIMDDQGSVWAVLDLDSTRLDAFSPTDAEGLERIASLF